MPKLNAFKNIVMRLYGVLDRAQRQRAVLVFISMLVSASLELLGVSTILPFLTIILNYDQTESIWYVNWLYVLFPDISFEAMILCFGVIIILVFLLKNVLAILFSYVQLAYASEFLRDSSTLMLDSYMMRPYEYFVNHNSGDILRGVNNDTSAVYSILMDLFQAAGELLTIIVVGIYLFETSWDIALGAIAISFVVFLGVFLGFRNAIKRAGKENRRCSAKRMQFSLQAINGIKEITVLNRRDYFVNQYNEATDKYAKTSLVYHFIDSCPDRLIEGLCVSGFMVIVCIKIVLGIDAKSFIPVLGAFVMGAFRILPSISKLTNRMNGILYYQPGLHHCYENIMEARKLSKKQNEENKTDRKSSRDIAFCKDLSIEGISWKYAGAERNTLDNLSMTIHKGESVAFIGVSGSGKTTLADIILGLYKPQAGAVRMDGIDIYTIHSEWRRIIGYVPQSVYLIDDSIRANVAFGVLPEEILDNKIMEALNQAQLSEFVSSLPQGINTIVGERGVKLSGGQKQRIAIARALYENPEILVLDEATSALDNETETAVMEAIEALRGHKTLIIAHRLSTIRNCDRIFEIKAGIAKEKNEI